MESANLKQIFGQTVKKYRQEKSISQEKLAEITGLHRTYISEVERGTRNVSLINIIKIAKGLDINSSQIFMEMEKNNGG
ncbi:helix-turn-helix transcriptional regulator [Priestia aryabhattai]|uniref:helix-turn-helix domain-containing protein n=1 Tax=Priestia aryabhattai TaxID=412384 RepID=UPI002E1C1E9F|nr:helix-turn-helix transcriptional regulator [Priestia aryabhattai]